MTKSSFLNLLFIMSMGTCLLVVGCGKKAETKDVGLPEVIRPPQTELNTYLDRQVVSCEGNQACPNYIAKIVIVQGSNKYNFCTGFLTQDNLIATSASCLPHLLRLNNQDCSNDVFFFFPKTAYRPAERMGCKKVVLVSDVNGEDPLLWRDDVVFLEMSGNVNFRKRVSISRLGLEDTHQYYTFMVDQQDEYSAVIKRSTCQAIHNNYVNPLASNVSSPNMMFGDCQVTNGGAGAPVIDQRGRVRGVLSRNMDPKVRNYLESTGLLSEPLKEMSHGTNFACAPTPHDIDLLDERECLKDLTYSKVDDLRTRMFSTDLLFSELRQKLENSLKDVSKYVHFGVKLIPNGDFQATEIYPVCFKPYAGWLNSFGNRNVFVDQVKLPVKTFRRAVDSFGRIIGHEIESPDETNFVQFSLKNIRASKKSSILIWQDTNNSKVRTYPNISEDCSSSLL